MQPPEDFMDDKHAWFSVDIAFALTLIAGSIYVIADSLVTSLPMVASDQATYLDMPGLSPILCAALLIVMAVGMIVSAYRKGGRLSWFATAGFAKALTGREARTVYKVFALLGAYVFLLWPHLPFWLSTGLFLAGFMAACGVLSWVSLTVSCVTAGTLWYVFLELFNVALPSRFVLGG
jgi:hypothetical protein